MSSDRLDRIKQMPLTQSSVQYSTSAPKYAVEQLPMVKTGPSKFVGDPGTVKLPGIEKHRGSVELRNTSYNKLGRTIRADSGGQLVAINYVGSAATPVAYRGTSGATLIGAGPDRGCKGFGCRRGSRHDRYEKCGSEDEGACEVHALHIGENRFSVVVGFCSGDSDPRVYHHCLTPNCIGRQN